MRMIGHYIDQKENRASEIIRNMLENCGGRAVVYTLRGLPCQIYADTNGTSFISDKLPITPPYQYSVFDIIVEFLLERGGHARKGNGRNYRLGEKNCDDTTVIGVISARYSHKKAGESVFDPVFVLAAVLEWANIAENRRGEIVLKEDYLKKL